MDVAATSNRLRALFPPLLATAPPAFLDNAAGSLVPQRVATAVYDVLTSRGVVNALPGYAWGREQAALRDAAHAATALFVNAPNGADEIAIGPSSTAMAFRLSAALSRQYKAGDAVVVSGLEHECNVSPWRELPPGVELRVWQPVWPEGALHLSDLESLMADGRVKLVALTAASNCFGLTTDVAGAARVAHAHGALIICDSVHGAPHHLPDVVRDDVDFLVFSPYKIGAPHLGCMYMRKRLVPLMEVPTLHFYDKQSISKMEYGTPPYEALAGWLAALQHLVVDVGGGAEGAPLTRAALVKAYAVVEALETPIKAALVGGLTGIPCVTVYGSTAQAARVGTVAFRVAGADPAAVALQLGDAGICVGNGHFYATLPNEALGLMPDGVVRASIAHYTSLDDIDRLVRAVGGIAKGAAVAVGTVIAQ